MGVVQDKLVGTRATFNVNDHVDEIDFPVAVAVDGF
jgi:hypothetical protein